MGKPFAKLYGPDDDQILVTLVETDDGEPALSIEFDTGVEGLGRVVIASTYTDNETGTKTAEDAFAAITEEEARRMTEHFRKEIQEVLSYVKTN